MISKKVFESEEYFNNILTYRDKYFNEKREIRQDIPKRIDEDEKNKIININKIDYTYNSFKNKKFLALNKNTYLIKYSLNIHDTQNTDETKNINTFKKKKINIKKIKINTSFKLNIFDKTVFNGFISSSSNRFRLIFVSTLILV